MEKIFLSVLNMSLTASFVIAVIVLVRLPLKKAPKIISYALWTVAGFRLVFPFTLESMFSLFPFKAAPIPQDIARQALPRIDSGIVVIDSAVNASLPAAVPTSSANPLQIWLTIGTYVWLLGILILLTYSFASVFLLKRGLRSARPIEDNLYEADNLKTPFVIGLFRPKIYLPTGLSDEERRFILLHEQTHIRRRDHAVKMLAHLVLCLHWFNPLVWTAFILMGADMEMACDERVIKELGADIKKAYSLSLVRVATGRKLLYGYPLAFGEGRMKQRIKNVLNFKRPPRMITSTAVALVAVLSVGFAVNRVFINDVSENKLLTRLGYTKELVLSVPDNRAAFSEGNAYIAQLVTSLPLPAYRRYVSFSLEAGQEISVVYEFDDDNNRSGNGLDPFPETVRENNALLLFAAVEGLQKVNFLHYDNAQGLNGTDSYTMHNLTTRFGEITPLDMSFADLYHNLETNIQLSEFYFSHHSRLYLGSAFEDVSYRNGDPNEIIQQADGSHVWIYSELDQSFIISPAGEQEIKNPGYTVIYYFNSPLAEQNDNLSGLYATISYAPDWKNYGDLTTFLGYPGIVKDMGNGHIYIAYPLREGEQRNAFFIAIKRKKRV
jgi:beta-lactamase regulating signal transducer with metallopeptidase domain